MSGRDVLTVAQVCHSALGGSSRAACRLADALSRRGHSSHVFSHDGLPWTLEPDVQRHHCRMTASDAAAPLHWDWTAEDRTRFTALLMDCLSRARFDLVHFHYALPFAEIMDRISIELGERMPASIVTLHGTDLTRSVASRDMLATLDRHLAAASAVTTVSEHMSTLAGRFLSCKLTIDVLPNFIDDGWPGTDAAGRLPFAASGKPAFLHVSNFRIVKDTRSLIDLFAEVRKRIDAELWLVGDGPEIGMIRAQADATEVLGDIRFVGACPCPAVYFRHADAFVSTSTEESFGIAILEALASGLPVVSTAVGGVPELVTDNETGILFHPDDRHDVAERLVGLLRSPRQREAMRIRCLRRAEPLREARVAGRYEQLYRDVLSKRTLRNGL